MWVHLPRLIFFLAFARVYFIMKESKQKALKKFCCLESCTLKLSLEKGVQTSREIMRKYCGMQCAEYMSQTTFFNLIWTAFAKEIFLCHTSSSVRLSVLPSTCILQQVDQINLDVSYNNSFIWCSKFVASEVSISVTVKLMLNLQISVFLCTSAPATFPLKFPPLLFAQ